MKFEQAFYTSANHLLKSSDNGIGICAASSTSRSFLTLAGQLAGRYQREKTMEYGSLEEAHIEQIVAYSTEFQRFTAAIIGPRKRREGDKRANGMCQILIPEEGSKPEDTLLDFRGYANMTVAEDVVTDSVEAETYHLGLKDILNTYQISKEALASLLDLVYMSLLKHRKTIVIRNDGEEVKSEQAALDITRLLLSLLPQEMQNRISIGLHAVLNFERVLLWYGTEKELEQARGECDIWDIHSTEYTHMFAYDIAEMAMQATSDEEVCHRLNEIMADYHRDVTPSTNEQEMELAFARLRLENADREHPAVVFMSPTAWQYLYNRAGRGEKWSEDTYLMYICQSDSEQIPKEGRSPLDFLLKKINNAEEWKKLSEQEQKQWIQAAVHCAAIYTDIRWENYLWICRQIKNPDVKSRFMNEMQALDNSPVNRTFEDIEDFCKVSLAYSGWKNPDYWDRAVAQAAGYLNNPELPVEDENLLIKTMNDAGGDKWKETIHSIMLKRITSLETIQEFSEKYGEYKDYLDLEKDKDALLDWGEKNFANSENEALLLNTMNEIDSGAWKEKIRPVMLKRITSQETVKEFAEMYEQYKDYLDLDKDKKALLDAMGERYQKPVLKDRERLSELAAKIKTSDDEWKNIALRKLNAVNIIAANFVQLCTESEIDAVEKTYIGEYYQKLYDVRTQPKGRESELKLKKIAGWIEERAKSLSIKLENEQILHDTFDEWDFRSLEEEEKVRYDPQTKHMFEYYFEHFEYYFERYDLKKISLYQLVTIAETLKSCKERYPNSKVDIAHLKKRIWEKTKTETEHSSSISEDTEKNLLLVRLKIWCALHEGDKMDFDFFGGVLKKKSYDDLKDILKYLKEQDSGSAAELFATTPNYTKEEDGSTIHEGKKIPLCYLIWFTYCEEEYFPEHLLKEMTVYYAATSSKHEVNQATSSKYKVNQAWKLDELREQNLWRIKDQSEQEKVLKSAINYLCLLVWDVKPAEKGVSKNKQDILKKELSQLEENQKKAIDSAVSGCGEIHVTKMELSPDFEKQLNTLRDYMIHNVQKGGSEKKPKETITEPTSQKELHEGQNVEETETFEQRVPDSELDQKFKDMVASLCKNLDTANLNGDNGNGNIGNGNTENTLEKILGTNQEN